MRVCPQCRLETEARSCPADGYKTLPVRESETAEYERRIGTTFEGRFELEEILGVGGMGVVYRAKQLNVGRTVAIKLMHQHMSQDLTHAARFQQEARAVAALKHPHAVRMLDFGCSENDQLYLVMEYLEGTSLEELLDDGEPLSEDSVVQIAEAILTVLAEAHERGIIHRDLKPENIFLANIAGQENFVKVLDFGIAKVSDELSAEMTLTRAGAVIGSPRYMSPEQATAKEVGPASDLYSLGVIMYECLTGVSLFECESPNEYMVAHVVEKPQPMLRNGARIKGPLADLVMCLLEKKKRNRPSDAREALAMLRLEMPVKGTTQASDVEQPAAPPVIIDTPPPSSGPASEPDFAFRETRRGAHPDALLTGVKLSQTMSQLKIQRRTPLWPWLLATVVLVAGGAFAAVQLGLFGSGDDATATRSDTAALVDETSADEVGMVGGGEPTEGPETNAEDARASEAAAGAPIDAKSAEPDAAGVRVARAEEPTGATAPPAAVAAIAAQAPTVATPVLTGATATTAAVAGTNAGQRSAEIAAVANTPPAAPAVVATPTEVAPVRSAPVVNPTPAAPVATAPAVAKPERYTVFLQTRPTAARARIHWGRNHKRRRAQISWKSSDAPPRIRVVADNEEYRNQSVTVTPEQDGQTITVTLKPQPKAKRPW